MFFSRKKDEKEPQKAAWFVEYCTANVNIVFLVEEQIPMVAFSPHHSPDGIMVGFADWRSPSEICSETSEISEHSEDSDDSVTLTTIKMEDFSKNACAGKDRGKWG